MNKWDWDAIEDARLYLRIEDAPGLGECNEKSRETIKKALEEAGFGIQIIKEGIIAIYINTHTFRLVHTRAAGRRKRYSKIDYRESKYGGSDFCRYSDIVWMSQTMTDQQICDKIGMKIATYYRHKKKLRESDYFRQLDQNRLSDREYLESVKGNLMF